MPISKARIIQDAKYPTMWRVRWPDGRLSDMVNLTRAHDAAARFNDALRPSGKAAVVASGARRSD